MTSRPSIPRLPPTKGLTPMPTPMDLVPRRVALRRLLSSQPKTSAPMSSASRAKQLESDPWLAPAQPSWPGAFTRRISSRSIPSSRAALSMMGSSMATIWAPPGARCAERGGVLVYTDTARKRMFSGW